MQFILGQRFVVQVWVSSCSETLTLVARYCKHKVFLAIPRLTQFPAKMVIVMRVQLKNKVESWPLGKPRWENN